VNVYEEILETNLRRLRNGLLPKYAGSIAEYDAADAPLLLFSAVQDLKAYKEKREIWKIYSPAMKEILSNFKKGTHYNIHMQGNGLIYAKQEGVALTWMDAYINGKPVTQRGGLDVEINAAWYNAICFALELAEESKDKAFINEWKDYPPIIAASFLSTFWSDEKGYLADYVDGDHIDWSVRPNMIIAISFEYSPLSREQKKMVVSLAKNELLTPKGLRTLAPANPNYKGSFEDSPDQRSAAAHQGSVYPFLVYPFVKSYLDIHQVGGLSFVKQIIAGFEDEMAENCVSTLSEVYEGNPPYAAQGAISQAWNVAGILRTAILVEKLEEQKREANS
jgi:predicted glycogen debranching enzyme